MKREFIHVAQSPMPGDIVEIREGSGYEECEVMLRVLAVVEEHVGFKEYGRGRFWLHLPSWRLRLCNAKLGKLIRPGDHDMPF